MKLHENSRSRSFTDLGQRLFRYGNKNLFFSETTVPFLTKFRMIFFRNKEMKINWVWSHDQYGRHAHISSKHFKNLLRNQWADYHETWYVALGTQANHTLFKSWRLDGLILGQGQRWSHRLLYGKKSKLCIFQKPFQPVIWKFACS